MVQFSPATREARVRFPADALLFSFFITIKTFLGYIEVCLLCPLYHVISSSIYLDHLSNHTVIYIRLHTTLSPVCVGKTTYDYVRLDTVKTSGNKPRSCLHFLKPQETFRYVSGSMPRSCLHFLKPQETCPEAVEWFGAHVPIREVAGRTRREQKRGKNSGARA